MIIDIKNSRYAIGPYARTGAVAICRLWLWDYIRVGNLRSIVWHEEDEP